jgi:hypothetical protein
LTEFNRPSLVKPTIQTRFQIDFNCWQSNDRDWRVYLYSNLCPEHQAAYANVEFGEQLDWVDPDTAEVQKVDGLQNVLITHCARQPGFLSTHSSLVDSAFRLFLSNGNNPMTVLEMSVKLGRPADLILRTLTGPRVYKGIRPLRD